MTGEARNNRISIWKSGAVVSAVCLLAVVLGTAISGAQDQERLDLIEFSERDAEPMCNGDTLDHTEFTYSDDQTGQKTAEAAADALVEEMKVGLVEMLEVTASERDSAFSSQLARLLEPSVSFEAGDRTESSDRRTVYFDNRSDKNGVLESRIVVQELNGGYVVTDSYRCVETYTTDAKTLDELISGRTK